ncbi:maleylacetoacetate isomerase [Mesorhizobium sp. ZC-5]|uniref:maleylacetoacetate isomerase n=1 Tax=Mesorhizobium sp. ZC-5 TaxID=2986066 RepID=UPI0021E8CD9B|nr:maleylacetoacetate isomerase [Mesorhizobium sp. ZC-5]MCV3240824.1 maleylacetoacetate isomerase [Mesorhizobium sp. ZC-5]
MRLLSRWQNSAGERVRIALRLKNLQFTYVPVSSLAPGEYNSLNPQGLLPALDVGGRIIAQSSAILDYLEETYPEPSLLPSEPITRAQARAFGALIASEMHAITVQRVRRFLQDELAVDETGVTRWVRNWMALGFEALEATLAQRTSQWPFCFGDEPGWADLHLVPQMSTARRLGCELAAYPLLLAVEDRCNRLDAFRLSQPEAQPDFLVP